MLNSPACFPVSVSLMPDRTKLPYALARISRWRSFYQAEQFRSRDSDALPLFKQVFSSYGPPRRGITFMSVLRPPQNWQIT
jgi:hypothetical protein